MTGRDQNTPPLPYNTGALWELIVSSFSASDLLRFCQVNSFLAPVLVDFGLNPSLSDMTRILIDYCRRRDLISELVQEIEIANPRQYARFKERMHEPGPSLSKAGTFPPPPMPTQLAHVGTIEPAMAGSRARVPGIGSSELARAEEAYLKTLIERFRKERTWDTTKYVDLYALFTDAEQEGRHLRHLWRLPGDEAMPKVEAAWGRRMRLMPYLRKKKRVMIKGDPGTGKTLALRRYAVAAAESAVNSTRKRRRIPLYIDLKEYRTTAADGGPQPVYEFLCAYISEEYPSALFLAEHLEHYLSEGQVILLLDGVNEMPPEDYLSRLNLLMRFTHQQYSRNQAVYTCRTLHYTSPSDFETILITDLDDDQVLKFLQTYLGHEAAGRMFQELASGDRFMLRLCRNPFMLRMLTSRALELSDVPENRSRLFEDFVTRQLAGAASPRSAHAETVIRFLRGLAFSMNHASLFAGSVTEAWISQVLAEDWQPALLEVAVQAQILDRTAGGRVQFAHQILQEYFAAAELVRLSDGGTDIDALLIDPIWEETIILAAGLQEEPEPFLQRLWDPDAGPAEGLWLAAKAMGASGKPVEESYRMAVLACLAHHLELRNAGGKASVWLTDVQEQGSITPAVDSVKALGYNENPESIRLLAWTVEQHRDWVQQVAIRTLGTMRGEEAHKALARAAEKAASFRTIHVLWSYLEGGEHLGLVYRSIPPSIRAAVGLLLGYFLLVFGCLVLAIIPAQLLVVLLEAGVREDVSIIASSGVAVTLAAVVAGGLLLWLARKKRFSPRRGWKAAVQKWQLAVAQIKGLPKRITPKDAMLYFVALILALAASCWADSALPERLSVYADAVGGAAFLIFWLPLVFGLWWLLLMLHRSHRAGRPPADLILEPQMVAFLAFCSLLAWGMQLLLHSEEVSAEALKLDWLRFLDRLLFIVALIPQTMLVLFCLWCYGRAGILAIRIDLLGRHARRFETRLPAIERLLRIVEDSSEWNKVRSRAARRLRAVDPLPQHVARLKSVDAHHYGLLRELQRTVYELELLLREKRRKTAGMSWQYPEATLPSGHAT